MDLAGLEIFKAAAEQGGITRAAARLHRVQSNLATLEDALRGELRRRRAGRARGSAGARSIAART